MKHESSSGVLSKVVSKMSLFSNGDKELKQNLASHTNSVASKKDKKVNINDE